MGISRTQAVKFIRNGNGISSVTEYYLASELSSGVTVYTEGWTTTVQTITAEKKYLWNYKVTTYSNGSKTTTPPVIIGTYGDKGDPGDKGDKGDPGDKGPTLRGPQAWSDCANGYAFQAGGAGEKWQDVVIYGDNYYSCVKSHIKSASNYPGSSVDTNNGYWQLGDKIELVATKILLATYALVKNLGVEVIEMKDADGNILFQAKDGAVICKTGTFNNIIVQSGKIAGFTISGNGLTNTPFDNDAYVLFKNDAHNCLAGIGGNVLPTSTGQRAVARFENEDSSDWWGIGHNIALLLSAKNGGCNHAFTGSGNGTLNGWIGGYGFSKFSCTKANTIYDGALTLRSNNRWIVYSSVSSSGVALPKLSDVRDALYIGQSTPFCVELTIYADFNSKNFSIYGRNKMTDSSGGTPWNNTDLPVLAHWDNGRYDALVMAAGDSVTFLLVYDPDKSASFDSFSLYYTARIINKQS